MTSLAALLRWTAEMPPALRAVPEGFPGGQVRVRAVVADLLETRYGSLPRPGLLDAFEAQDASAAELNRLRWVLAASHVLWHPVLRGPGSERPAELERFLTTELGGLGAALDAGALDSEEERREELVRRVLRALGLRPEGESAEEAQDRLRQLDSVERQRLVAAAAQRERRGRELREAMAKRAAEEAAAKVSRE